MKDIMVQCSSANGAMLTHRCQTCDSVTAMVAALPFLRLCYATIQIWSFGHHDNFLYDSIRMVGNPDHTIRINAWEGEGT